MQASSALADDATAHETAARLGALWSHLFLSDRGEHLRVMEESGLTVTQCKALFLLAGDAAGDGEPAQWSVKDMAERLGISVAALSRAVDGLVRARLATRTEDPEDRRVRRLAIAARGREVVGRITAARMVVLEAFVETLSASERRKLDTALVPITKRPGMAAAYTKLREIDLP
jgi:DNA-binding MarR family transcriptional regulator